MIILGLIPYCTLLNVLFLIAINKDTKKKLTKNNIWTWALFIIQNIFTNPTSSKKGKNFQTKHKKERHQDIQMQGFTKKDHIKLTSKSFILTFYLSCCIFVSFFVIFKLINKFSTILSYFLPIFLSFVTLLCRSCKHISFIHLTFLFFLYHLHHKDKPL